uniref:Uncharacterized protein n=1 Tax=Oryza glumipatula TaxID=40148 RepID=A0A0E0AUL1_9ORYZ
MPTITPVQHCVPLSSPSSAVSSSGRGGKRQGAPPPASFGDAAKRAQSHGGHPANDSIRASGGLSSPISSATHGRCLFFCRNIKFLYAFVMLDEMVESAVHNLSARCHAMLQQRRKLIQFPSASGPCYVCLRLLRYRLSHEAMTVFWVISAATYWASNGVKGKSDHPMPASDPPLAQVYLSLPSFVW